MLGFWLMTLCVFEIVRRQSSVVTALAAVLRHEGLSTIYDVRWDGESH